MHCCIDFVKTKTNINLILIDGGGLIFVQTESGPRKTHQLSKGANPEGLSKLFSGTKTSRQVPIVTPESSDLRHCYCVKAVHSFAQTGKRTIHVLIIPNPETHQQ